MQIALRCRSIGGIRSAERIKHRVQRCAADVPLRNGWFGLNHARAKSEIAARVICVNHSRRAKYGHAAAQGLIRRGRFVMLEGGDCLPDCFAVSRDAVQIKILECLRDRFPVHVSHLCRRFPFGFKRQILPE
ncbi:hypothetical protein [Paraburkholderia humisilvae]|uniref:hypothetical protein n=1 Tax=Paraburkholderia humisilvae TaxID=627669 RepID=UPI0015822AF5|nr:hypothetical protein [Paraburkholderia humisilvae]